LAGLIALNWPSRPDINLDLGGATSPAIVRSINPCPPEASAGPDTECAVIRIEITAGEDRNQLFELPPVYGEAGRFGVGDAIVVDRIEEDLAPFRYVFVDRDRKAMLWVLAAAFGLTVMLLGGLRGLRALLGLAASIAVLGLFTMPALLNAQSPLLIACLTAGAISFAALYLSHGFAPMTSVAVLGTLASLSVTVALGSLFINLARFSGFASEESFFIRSASESIDLGGLLLAGLVIGALGALDDMTVTQASVVFELRGANQRRSRRALFESAMRVGRDHVASTVNTLFLAYAGASLPLLMLFVIGDLPVVDVLNSEIVATELVRTLVGSIGLVASVPLTTLLAVWVVTHSPLADSSSEARPPKRRPQSIGESEDQAGNRPSLRQRLRSSIED
jgi:uncharacterized membrane protein